MCSSLFSQGNQACARIANAKRTMQSRDAALSAQAGDTRIPLPRKSLWHPQKIVDCKVGLCTGLWTVAEFL